jgi:hypothetical protein
MKIKKKTKNTKIPEEVSGFIIPNFFFCEVTRRVICPDISVYGFGPYSEVPIANIEPFAQGTAISMSFYQGFSVFKPCHEFITQIIPDFTEWTFPHIPKGVMPPELVGMYRPVPGYAAYTYS